jgi:class 3 adenylate cyclase
LRAALVRGKIPMAESEAPHVGGFLFADLRSYTQFVERHGDQAASELLSAYRSLVRAAVADFSGAEIRTEGDGFYVVFPSASSAIRCALVILEQAAASIAAAGGPLPVGVGIHAGETADSAEGFVGSAVNIAARVCALAAPGELLVTETVRGLVRTSLPLAMEPRRVTSRASASRSHFSPCDPWALWPGQAHATSGRCLAGA